MFIGNLKYISNGIKRIKSMDHYASSIKQNQFIGPKTLSLTDIYHNIIFNDDSVFKIVIIHQITLKRSEDLYRIVTVH